MKKFIVYVGLSLVITSRAATFRIKNNLDKEVEVLIHSVMPLAGDADEQKLTLKPLEIWPVNTGFSAPTYISWDIYSPAENVRWTASINDISAVYTGNGVFNIRRNGYYDVPGKSDRRQAERSKLQPKRHYTGGFDK